MTQLHFVPEPNRLHLIWQSSRPNNRTKFVVGELVRTGSDVSLTYRHYSQDLGHAIVAGFEGHPAFPLNTAVHHANVIEVFARRLPSRSRSDFITYLARNCLPTNQFLTDFTLLGRTGGSLPSDGFSCAIDFRYESLPNIFLMEIAGFRYHEGMNLNVHDLVSQNVFFVNEDGNEHDPQAVAIYTGVNKLGYVPRYYARLFRIWKSLAAIHAVVQRIDGTLTKPQVHVLVQVYSAAVHATTPLIR